jgi:3-dehydrosphinganine reductase
MNHTMRFQDQIALITGGSSGIGLALGRLLAAEGAHVWLLARREPELANALEQVKANQRNSGQIFGTISADVTDAQQVFRAIAEVEERLGTPDLVINSAGVAHPGYFQDLDLEIFRWMMEVNYFGTVHVVKAVLPGMLARRSGHIVNISSMAGVIGLFGYTAYGASKYAVRGFSDALRAELKPLGIHVSIVFPPDTDTPQLAYDNRFKPAETKALSAMASVVSPEVVAKAVLDGVVRHRYVIIPGLDSQLLYRLIGLLGNGVYPIMDFLVSRARRRVALHREKGTTSPS